MGSSCVGYCEYGRAVAKAPKYQNKAQLLKKNIVMSRNLLRNQRPENAILAGSSLVLKSIPGESSDILLAPDRIVGRTAAALGRSESVLASDEGL